MDGRGIRASEGVEMLNETTLVQFFGRNPGFKNEGLKKSVVTSFSLYYRRLIYIYLNSWLMKDWRIASTQGRNSCNNSSVCLNVLL